MAIFWGVVPAWACATLTAMTVANLALLAWLGCGDPGIAKRRREKPVEGPLSLKKWLWNDQANTWRAQKDSYSQVGSGFSVVVNGGSGGW